MYNELSFALEKEHVDVKSMDEALNAVKLFKTNPRKVSLNDITISLNGGANLKVTDETMKITQWSLQSLCRFLGIPDPFARKIPIDLLQKNISRLLQEKRGDFVSLLIGKENEIVNIVKANYKPFENDKLLSKLNALFNNGKSIEWESMRVGPRGFDLNVVDPSIKPLEPKVGDITKIGFRIVNSDTGFRDAIAKVYLFRLACTNGATLTDDWGAVRRRANRNISEERDLEYFVNGVQNLNINFDRLKTVYDKMPETFLTDFQVEGVWKAISRVAGPEQADAVIEKDEEGRKAILHLVTAKRAHNRQLFVEALKEPAATDVNAYNTHNRITDASKQYKWQDALRMQSIGGRMISMLVEGLGEN